MCCSCWHKWTGGDSRFFKLMVELEVSRRGLGLDSENMGCCNLSESTGGGCSGCWWQRL